VTKEEATTAADEGAPVTLTVRPTQEKSDHEPMSNSDESQSSSKTLGASPASQGQPRQPHPRPKCDVHAYGAKVEAEWQ